MKIEEGSLVLIYLDKRRKRIVKVKRGETFASDRGKIDLSELIGKEYGDVVETSLGFKAYLLEPTLEDVLYSFSRRTQVIYPKDIALMTVKLGVKRGKRCLEGGSGSGFVTATLSWFGCEVHSFEARKEHLRVAKSNLRRFGLDSNVTFVNADLAEADKIYPRGYFDLAVIDVGDPWKVVEPVWNVLRGGSPISFWLPTFNQLEKLKKAIEGKFLWLEALEVRERRIKVEEGATRPEQFGVTFTGYMVIARKVMKE